MTRTLLLIVLFLSSSYATKAGEEFVSLFNGKDLTDWDGDPALWKVENGVIVGTCSGPDSPKHNDFLIWRGGVLKDFELTATVRVKGDNNSGVQYRSRPLSEVGPWAITGYQCDIHPEIEHTAMTYEEKGRGIFGLNGQTVMVDPEGERWLVAEHEPIAVDVSEWNEYTIITRGNVLAHYINGKLSSQMTDFDEKGRALEGLLAIQLHSGNAHVVEIKEVKLKTLSVTEPLPFTESSIPAGAKPVEKPKTRNPQGVGTPSPRGKAN